jgi:uncharacterized Zn-binding protein involved in type VI secretion
MSRGTARLDDKTTGSCSVHGDNIGGRIITASGDTIVNSRGVARLGDKVKADCGHEAVIITASPNITANNRGVARLNDQVGNSPYTGRIITASPNDFTN